MCVPKRKGTKFENKSTFEVVSMLVGAESGVLLRPTRISSGADGT